jgi:membrane associated rhomboid family serine protease
MLRTGRRQQHHPDPLPLTNRLSPPIFNAPPVVGWIASLNLFVHIARLVLPTQIDNALLWNYAYVAARYDAPDAWLRMTLQLALSPISYAFLHADATHLMINVFLFLPFGTVVGRRMGGWRFLLLYLVCAVGAVLFWTLLNQGSAAPLIGASGAISGMIGAVGWLSLRPHTSDQPPPIKHRGTALSFVVIWLGLNVLFGLLPPGFFGVEGGAIAWEAHLGGFLTGFLLIRFFDRPRPIGQV